MDWGLDRKMVVDKELLHRLAMDFLVHSSSASEKVAYSPSEAAA